LPFTRRLCNPFFLTSNRLFPCGFLYQYINRYVSQCAFVGKFPGISVTEGDRDSGRIATVTATYFFLLFFSDLFSFRSSQSPSISTSAATPFADQSPRPSGHSRSREASTGGAGAFVAHLFSQKHHCHEFECVRTPTELYLFCEALHSKKIDLK